MVRSYPKMFLLAMLASGCASAPKQKVVVADTNTQTHVTPVSHQEELNASELAKPNIDAEPVPLPASSGLSLEAVEELALANNPAIAQAEARICALQGKWLQVGLAPNPTVGYVAAEIGADGSAGQQGGFVGQQFITAQKLERNRAIVCAEISQAQQQLAEVIRRVQTDVRVRYYEALLAQKRLDLAKDLVHLSMEATETSKALIKAKEIPLAGLLQTEVQLQNAQLLQRTSENGWNQSWRKLTTLLGSELFAEQVLEGDVSTLPTTLDYEQQLARLQTTSPEVATAMAEVQRTRRVLNRECVEAVPNINTQVSVQYDDAANETLTGVQVGIPLPIWNRNQGGIRKARAEVVAAKRNVDRVEWNLQQRLADAFREYSDASITVDTYAQEILTRAEQTLELVQQGYAQGEVGYLDLLTAQRTYSQTNLAYLDALGNLWKSYLRIDGLLLEGSLNNATP